MLVCAARTYPLAGNNNYPPAAADSSGVDVPACILICLSAARGSLARCAALPAAACMYLTGLALFCPGRLHLHQCDAKPFFRCHLDTEHQRAGEGAAIPHAG